MPLPDHYEFLCPSKLISGQSALKNLPVELQALGSSRPLVLADQKAIPAGVIKRVTGAFKGSQMTMGVFDQVPEKPSSQFVTQLVALIRDKGHDALVAVGPGKIADLAKGVRLAAAHPSGAMAAVQEGGAGSPPLPWVQVMTGPGTGLEASGSMSLAGTRLADHGLMPDLIVVDPQAIHLEDSRMAAESALGILARAAEACAGTGANPLVDTYAHGAMALVRANIQTLLAKPGDKKAKTALTVASVMAGAAFTNAPAGPSHCLSMAAMETTGLSSGFLAGMILPYSLGWFASRDPEPVARLLLSLGGFDSFSDTSPRRRAEAAIEKVFELIRTLAPAGITGPLGRHGISQEMTGAVAASAAGFDTELDAPTMEEILAKAVKGGVVEV